MFETIWWMAACELFAVAWSRSTPIIIRFRLIQRALRPSSVRSTSPTCCRLPAQRSRTPRRRCTEPSTRTSAPGNQSPSRHVTSLTFDGLASLNTWSTHVLLVLCVFCAAVENVRLLSCCVNFRFRNRQRQPHPHVYKFCLHAGTCTWDFFLTDYIVLTPLELDDRNNYVQPVSSLHVPKV